MNLSGASLTELEAMADDPDATEADLRAAMRVLARELARVNDEPPRVSTTVMTDALAQIINGPALDTIDMLELVTAAAETYPEHQRPAVYLSFDFCPVHRCDVEICADDRADCPAGRGEL